MRWGTPDTAVIGFGEAGSTFALSGRWRRRARVYDRLTDSPASASAKRADYGRAEVFGCETLADALEGTDLILSLVTADAALEVAREVSGVIAPGAVFCDLNSVAPETKRSAAELIEAAGGAYVDVAVMSPVQPAGLSAPLLISGPRAEDAMRLLRRLGFDRLDVVGDEVGRASSIKMIRSVMVKGIEALTAECVLAAAKAGVLDEVVRSLDASWPGADWARRADYNLDRMMVHGLRRSAEMGEVVRTLADLGVGADMSRGTYARQAAMGALGLKPPPAGLNAKIDQILHKRAQAA